MNLVRLHSHASEVLRLSRSLKANPVSSLARFAWLLGYRKFSALEVFSEALLDPVLSWSDLNAYRSKTTAWPIYQAYNRHPDLILLEDKARFQERCEEFCLPALPCHALLARVDLELLEQQINRGQIEGFRRLLDRLPVDFVAKPSFSYQGFGVEFFRKTGGSGLETRDGTAVTPGQFAERLINGLQAPPMGAQAVPEARAMLLQQMGVAHPSIEALSGSQVMQSVRLCTILDDTHRADIHFSFMKILVGENLIDNFQKGKTGNVMAFVGRESGRVFRAIRNDPVLGVCRLVSHHPDTGAPLIGFEVPYWHQACELAKRAAVCFGNTRAIGWDVGITPEGPVLLEGNGNWDPIAPLYQPFPRVRRRPSKAFGSVVSEP